MIRVLPTAEFASLVHGPEGGDLDDAAEAFHEASRLYPNVAPERLATLLALGGAGELQETVRRAGRLRPGGARVELPRGELPATRLGDAIAQRESGLGPRRTLSLDDVGTVLAAVYAATERRPGELRRPVPSGGALYPLELYLVPLAVAGLEPCAYHYDPFNHRLEQLGTVAPADVEAALVDPSLVAKASALLVVAAMFWRTRFKYGLRGYRFALLEAGHAMQNAVLSAAARRLPALPLGGFYDRRLDALVGADGLEEAAVYALLLGGAG